MENQALRQARENKGWSQRDVAEQIGTNRFTVTRWERGLAIPGPHYRQKLSALFGLSPRQLGFLKAEKTANIPPLSTYWNVPYHRNSFFTGREDLLRLLFMQFQGHPIEEGPPIIALSGLGGVGKTQLAIEYAYRHRSEYQAVLWVSADSPTMLLADFGNLTQVLHLRGKDEQDQQQAIKAVQCWLTEQGSWLLVFDNVEDIEIVHSLIPTTGQGHVLLTTRLQATSTLAKRIDVDVMTPEEGTLFLLRRAKIIPATVPSTAVAPSDLQAAQTLSTMMEALPLALDQAGAYIEETGCNIAGYLKRSQEHQLQLLQRRGCSTDHPTSVAATWSLSFQKLQQSNATAATLLQLCALLHPDAIPEELFLAASPPHLLPLATDLLHLDSIINALRAFSLIRRHPETCTLSLHRLVQTVLVAKMDRQMQQLLTKQLVYAVNAVFPDCLPSTRQLCHRYLSQALACAQLLQQWHLAFPEAARLLYQTGVYLQARASYDQADQLYKQALEIHEQLASTKQPEGARCLFALATLYEIQWKAQEAEKLYQQVLTIQMQSLESGHPEVAQTLNTLAMFYYKKGHYSQAEPLYFQALDIFQQKLGSEHPDVARCLSDLASLYREQGKYRQAEALQKQALHIRERVFGPDHLETATSLRNLAILYHEQGQFKQAESLYKQALAIRTQQLGPDHPDVALILRGLGLLSYGQSHYSQAEAYYRRVLHIRQNTLRPEHPLLGDVLGLLAELYIAQERWSEAKEYFQRTLEIWEPALEADSPDLAHCFNGMAEVAVAQGEYAQAEVLCQRALAILKQTLGEKHHYVAQSLRVLAALRCAQERYEQAEAFYQQALTTLEHNFGKLHPQIISPLNGLANMYQKLARYPQAAPLYERMLTIYAQFQAPDHPDVVHCQRQCALVRLQMDRRAAEI
ncbi:MAG TPA: FxSxx-COOH system tetratricopeptide repeat protein [Ktedonobacteraceae bacterium]|nr:FxSxx-COOH system tetratricopeptide repeat protein [Ktedonobacteraceae bacterium]